MCGITLLLNKLNKKNAVYYVLKSLEQLQNRGYDSFGLSFYNKNKYEINKICNKNYDKDIFEIFYNKNKNHLSNIAFGHSRWATHGKISNENAHPHVSNNKLFMCVHNGIIENYDELKKKLIKNGYDFYSETDTEVIINLIEYNYYQTKNVKEAIELSIKELKGTYGLIISDMTREGVFYIIRNGSPLLLGISEEFLMITSENRGFLNLIKNYYNIKNDELVIIEDNKIKSKITLEKEYTCDNNDIILGDYDHYTIKEINEQSNTLLIAINNGGRIVDNRIKLGGIEFLLSYLNEIKNIVFLGCGTSLYACEIGANYIKSLNMNLNTFVYDGGEFCESDIPKNGKCLFIFVSQSGETMDLITKIDLVKSKGHLTMGIINTVDSSIAKNVDCGIYLNAGKEIAVASTKSFTSSLMVMKLFSLWLNQYILYKKELNNQIINNINDIIYQIKDLNENIEEQINKIDFDIIKDNVFILGKGKMEFIAKECSLKMKEICYIHAEGYNGSSLKHGPFALLDKNVTTILIIDRKNKEKMMNTYNEIKCRDVNILVISELKNLNIEDYILLPENKELQEIINIVFLQHLCYKLAIKKGINPDKPRNLAKVVTVE
jgi:glucosamine--fructose-6-phosphate aminotransferase (isomerizing)